MREIKFRAWDKDGRVFIYELGHWDDSINMLKPSEELEKGWPHLELMQYSGLKDKSGKEIYEGDILLDLRGFKETVEWGSYPNDIEAPGPGFHIYRSQDSEVIGNIYENKELLNDNNR